MRSSMKHRYPFIIIPSLLPFLHFSFFTPWERAIQSFCRRLDYVYFTWTFPELENQLKWEGFSVQSVFAGYVICCVSLSILWQVAGMEYTVLKV
jgi:hypothetical protein